MYIYLAFRIQGQLFLQTAVPKTYYVKYANELCLFISLGTMHTSYISVMVGTILLHTYKKYEGISKYGECVGLPLLQKVTW